MRGSLLRGMIRTETPEARDLILSQLDRLRKALEDRGLRVGDLDVQVESRARRLSGDGPGPEREPEADAGNEVAPRPPRRGRLDVLA